MIRLAVPEDAAEASVVLTASVTELCRSDHGDDPIALKAWLANKTPEAVARMIANPALRLLVCLGDGEAIAAVGGWMMQPDGAALVVLLYVAPWARGQGGAAALLSRIEGEMRAAGAREGVLTATGTARDFYLRRGWQPDGAPAIEKGVLGHPMRKAL